MLPELPMLCVGRFVSAEDVGRKERYSAIEQILADVNSVVAAAATFTNASADSAGEGGGGVGGRLAQLQAAVGQLASGAAGPLRRGLEMEVESAIHELSAELKGEAPMPLGYCGSCYGAAPVGTCCSTCDEVQRCKPHKTRAAPTRRLPQTRRRARFIYMYMYICIYIYICVYI